MATIKRYINESVDDKKYFLEQSKRIKKMFDDSYNNFDVLCKELHDQGDLMNDLSSPMDKVELFYERITKELDKIDKLIKRNID